MRPEEEIAELRENDSLRNRFIQENEGFILSSASKAAGKFIDRSSDEFSTALIAFNEAIERYSPEKGGFNAFAKVVIKSRIIDEKRKIHMNTIPFSQLQSEDEDGNTSEFDPIGAKDAVTEQQLEMALLKEELEAYDISFFELPKFTPKSKKTKRETYKIVKYISENKALKKSLELTGNIPVSAVITGIGASRKLMERHRKYIIAAVVILCGDYPLAAGYIRKLEEV